MSLTTLPGQLFAEVVSWLYEKVGREELGGGFQRCSFQHDTKATLQCFSSLSKTLCALAQRTTELYLYGKSLNYWGPPATYHHALALRCSRQVNDWRIASLLASPFRNVAAQLLLIDLRATSISATAVITILQTCSSLEELDVGECQNFSVLNLARRLKEVPRESLVVRRLQKMEICGTGNIHCENWVGYRQQLICEDRYGIEVARRYDWDPRSRSPDIPKHDEAFLHRVYLLGSEKVLRAVDAIEDIIHSFQRSATFSMHVNCCENCLTFAQYVPYNGRYGEPYDSKTYGLHTCMVCGDARFLCRGCVGYSYHYCAEDKCKSCVCVRCDGGHSVKGTFESGFSVRLVEGGTLWQRLLDRGTTHFKLVECCYKGMESCILPRECMIICKDERTCGAGGSSGHGQDICKKCGLWQCGECAEPGDDRLNRCTTCGTRECTRGCTKVEFCDSCYDSACTACGPMRFCQEGCEGVHHCPKCYRDHPAAVAAMAKRKGWM